MPAFGNTSKNNLEESHPLLQELFNEVIKTFDCSIIQGFRNEEEQNQAYQDKKTTLQFPDSKHNETPSLAVDVCPYPIDWANRDRFHYFAGFVKGVAARLGISVRWGGDWDNDTETKDNNFDDLPHFELVSTEKVNGFNQVEFLSNRLKVVESELSRANSKLSAIKVVIVE